MFHVHNGNENTSSCPYLKAQFPLVSHQREAHIQCQKAFKAACMHSVQTPADLCVYVYVSVFVFVCVYDIYSMISGKIALKNCFLWLLKVPHHFVVALILGISAKEIIFFFFFFCFLGLHPQHMEVPRLGVELELQLPAYTITTATRDPSSVCHLHHSSCQCWISHPLSEARDQTRNLLVPSQIHFCKK